MSIQTLAICIIWSVASAVTFVDEEQPVAFSASQEPILSEIQAIGAVSDVDNQLVQEESEEEIEEEVAAEEFLDGVEEQGFEFVGTPVTPLGPFQQDPVPTLVTTDIENPWLTTVGSFFLSQVTYAQEQVLTPSTPGAVTLTPSQEAVDSALAGCPGILNIPNVLKLDIPPCLSSNFTGVGAWRNTERAAPLLQFKENAVPLHEDSLIFEVVSSVPQQSGGPEFRELVATTQTEARPQYGETDIGIYDCFGRQRYVFVERVFLPSVNHAMPLESVNNSESLVEWRLFDPITNTMVARTKPEKLPIFPQNITFVNMDNEVIVDITRDGERDGCTSEPNPWSVTFAQQSPEELADAVQNSSSTAHPTSLRHQFNRWIPSTIASLVAMRENRRDVTGVVPPQTTSVVAWVELFAVGIGSIFGVTLLVWLVAYQFGRSMFKTFRKFEQRHLIAMFEDDSAVCRVPVNNGMAEIVRPGPAPSGIRF